MNTLFIFGFYFFFSISFSFFLLTFRCIQNVESFVKDLDVRHPNLRVHKYTSANDIRVLRNSTFFWKKDSRIQALTSAKCVHTYNFWRNAWLVSTYSSTETVLDYKTLIWKLAYTFHGSNITKLINLYKITIQLNRFRSRSIS